jgi:hypothetical protein
MDRKMNWILDLPSLQGTCSHSPLTLAEIFILRIAEGMTEVYFRKVMKALGTWSRCVYFFSGRYRRYVQLGQKVKQNSVHISMPKLWYSKRGWTPTWCWIRFTCTGSLTQPPRSVCSSRGRAPMFILRHNCAHLQKRSRNHMGLFL